ncbi:SPS-sensor component PTR3 [Candida viswanathii]|uniref:SPS-sensor component PTR3 n=1 Tax=Candida viswanathii TaxID=5486 RepID=A0A367XSL5_9ASCO|nr:SPS-sensor component PTR3 [Candida viswanathii]
MDKIVLLEDLLRFPGYDTNIVFDASVLTCGCLTSEYTFKEQNQAKICPNCQAENVAILAPVRPLRELYLIIQNMQAQHYQSQPQQLDRRRRSSSKKSFKGAFDEGALSMNPAGESTDLISLFYKFAKEEQLEVKDAKRVSQSQQLQQQQQQQQTLLPQQVVKAKDQPFSDYAKVQPIEISKKLSNIELNRSYPSSILMNSTSISPHNHKYLVDSTLSVIQNSNTDLDTTINNNANNSGSLASNLLESVSEQKEFNFTKCFPFHRKLTTFPTQQLKLNFSAMVPFKLSGSSYIKRAVSMSINSYLDFNMGTEVTQFAIINEKKWELYEYIVPMGDTDISQIKPQLICCGKLTGEYGENSNSLTAPGESSIKEIFIRNDFGAKDNSNSGGGSDADVKKILNSWDQMYCKLTKNYLVISGSKGVMRVFNVNKSSPYEFGQPIYTYITNFPIRCIAVSPNNALLACGITARERITGKEQPFVILHRLVTLDDLYLDSVDPITITIPSRDPIKIINFNASSTHLVIATSWESRYLIIKLTDQYQSDNYRKPRLIWSDVMYKSSRRINDNNSQPGSSYDERAEAENDLMLSKEGITDLKFGIMNSNMVISTSCSLNNRPPILIRLEGCQIDSPVNISGNEIKSVNSVDEEAEYLRIASAETFMKITEIGSLIHQVALSPRGDGIVFLDKDGKLYLVSLPNFYPGRRISTTDSKNKRIVVLLGEVANAERFSESASVVFSSDGGKVFALDRKGVFSVFDFTKGVPGKDPDVIKCKIVSL